MNAIHKLNIQHARIGNSLFQIEVAPIDGDGTELKFLRKALYQAHVKEIKILKLEMYQGSTNKLIINDTFVTDMLTEEQFRPLFDSISATELDIQTLLKGDLSKMFFTKEEAYKNAKKMNLILGSQLDEVVSYMFRMQEAFDKVVVLLNNGEIN